MNSQPPISVYHPEDQELNGLGMMLLQYLEQNLAEFDYKVKQGLGLSGQMVVEVEKGIAITVSFQGERIRIENGVADNPDLHLKGSYLLLSKVLTGQASPLLEILRGNLKLKTFPRHPYRSLNILRFLKMPPELVV